MPLPAGLARLNRRVTNPITRPLAGHAAPLALVEHRGRRSGRTYSTPVFAFRGRDAAGADVVTFALTYGGGVDWLANAAAAGGARLHHRGRLLRLGPPVTLTTDEGRHRVPAPVRAALRLLRVTEFAAMPVLADGTRS